LEATEPGRVLVWYSEKNKKGQEWATAYRFRIACFATVAGVKFKYDSVAQSIRAEQKLGG